MSPILRRAPHALLTASAALLLAACGPTADDAPSPTEAPTESTVAPQPASDAAPARVGYDALVGSPESVRVVGSDNSEATVTMGTPIAEATAALAPYLGTPTDTGAYESCGGDPEASYVAWGDGFTLSVSQGAFAGWMAAGSDERYQTARGVQLGSTLEMAALTAPSLERVESTLDGEFVLGDGVGGFVSAGDPPTVEGLYGGLTCFAR